MKFVDELREAHEYATRSEGIDLRGTDYIYDKMSNLAHCGKTYGVFTADLLKVRNEQLHKIAVNLESEGFFAKVDDTGFCDVLEVCLYPFEEERQHG